MGAPGAGMGNHVRTEIEGMHHSPMLREIQGMQSQSAGEVGHGLRRGSGERLEQERAFPVETPAGITQQLIVFGCCKCGHRFPLDSLAKHCRQVFLRRTDGGQSEFIHQHVQHVGTDKGGQGRTDAHPLQIQVQQGQ